MHPLLQALHLSGVVVWVGGMFFAWVCLRPVAATQLEAPARLALWNGVFQRFFPWVWISVAAILASGFGTLAVTGMRGVPMSWHLMLALGLIMTGIFIYVFFVPYQRLQAAVASQTWPAGGAALGSIRQLVGINLLLGLFTVAVATAGKMI